MRIILYHPWYQSSWRHKTNYQKPKTISFQPERKPANLPNKLLDHLLANHRIVSYKHDWSAIKLNKSISTCSAIQREICHTKVFSTTGSPIMILVEIFCSAPFDHGIKTQPSPLNFYFSQGIACHNTKHTSHPTCQVFYFEPTLCSSLLSHK